MFWSEHLLYAEPFTPKTDLSFKCWILLVFSILNTCVTINKNSQWQNDMLRAVEDTVYVVVSHFMFFVYPYHTVSNTYSIGVLYIKFLICFNTVTDIGDTV